MKTLCSIFFFILVFCILLISCQSQKLNVLNRNIPDEPKIVKDPAPEIYSNCSNITAWNKKLFRTTKMHLPVIENPELFNSIATNKLSRIQVKIDSEIFPNVRLKETEPAKEEEEKEEEVVIENSNTKKVVVKNDNLKKTEKKDNKKKIDSERNVGSSNIKTTYSKILAIPGYDFEINFKNPGWIFLGYKNESDKAGYTFLSRKNKDYETQFNFRALKYGNFELVFLLQNFSNGTEQKEIVLLDVVSEAQFDIGISEDTDSTTITSSDFVYAETLFNTGQYQQALKEYLKHDDKDSPLIIERIANIYSLLGDQTSALNYWKKNVKASEEYSDKAIIEVIRAATALSDLNIILEYIDLFLLIKDIPINDDLIKISRFLEENEQYLFCLRILNQYLNNNYEGSYLDEIYYRLGIIYEKEDKSRDLVKAKEYYNKVYSDFPDSDYAELAEQRIKYLNRHFFYIW